MVPVTHQPEAVGLSDVVKHKIEQLGYILDPEQLHIGGERSVMSAHKLVLTGRHGASGNRVVIKVSLDTSGAQDIAHEHEIRELLKGVRFAERELHFPRELLFLEDEGLTISITEFIEQEKIFVAHSLREQFFMALNWFEAQEEFHATTHEHVQSFSKVCANWTSNSYLKELDRIAHDLEESVRSDRVDAAIAQVRGRVETHAKLIDRYGGFLNHTDLVPHNMRISSRTLYALDQVSIWFGNKYEGWARFINYMTIHNQPLAHLLTTYVREQRGNDDDLLLRIMRCYKIAVLLRYYARAIDTTEGDLKKLSELRFEFWLTDLEHLLDNKELSPEYVAAYTTVRDQLRSSDEKRRQQEFAAA